MIKSPMHHARSAKIGKDGPRRMRPVFSLPGCGNASLADHQHRRREAARQLACLAEPEAAQQPRTPGVDEVALAPIAASGRCSEPVADDDSLAASRHSVRTNL